MSEQETINPQEGVETQETNTITITQEEKEQVINAINSLHTKTLDLEARLEASNSKLTDPKYLDELSNTTSNNSNINGILNKSDEQLESMTNRELLGSIKSMIDSTVNTTIKPLAEQAQTAKQLAENNAQTQELQKAASDLEKVARKYNDENAFDFIYKNPLTNSLMKTVADSNPTWDAEQVYTAAKREYDKYTEKSGQKEVKETKETNKVIETEKPGSKIPSDDTNTHMSAQDAFMKAWEETMKKE